MSITTRSPMREIDALRERMDKLFADLTVRPRTLTEPGAPALDVQETDTEIVVTAAVPGFKVEDLTIEINQGMLTISGESTEEREEKSGIWHVQERRTGSIRRSFTLPTPVYEDEVSATLENGVLTVRLPKSERAPTRRIEIAAK